MTYRSRRADLTDDLDVENLRDLHTLTFGDTAPMAEFDYGAWWLVYPAGEQDPIAFAGIVKSSYGPGYAYFKRMGVLPGHRGHGLQRRLIRVRERWARKEGFHTIITDTCENSQSANNLVRCGFKLFDPPVGWGLKGSIYFRKSVSPPLARAA
jgi:GNAT superfamily N-acetyltransferase